MRKIYKSPNARRKMDYDNKVANGDLTFGLSFMSHLKDGNASISPTSIRIALAMLYEGATGTTAKQIADVAAIPKNASIRHKEINTLVSSLNETDVPYKLKCANGIWIANTYSLNQDFRETLTSSYKAEVQLADFPENPKGELVKINKWVGEKTEDKIPALFPVGSIDESTALVLANALYFKAPWQNKFNPKYTQKQDYSLSSGEIVQVDMMKKGSIDSAGQLPKFGYGEFDGVQAVMLPYEGNRLIKMVMLPPNGTSIKDLEAHLRENKMTIMDLYAIMSERPGFTKLELPKHELKNKYDLTDLLKPMGIDKMFTQAAEFEGIGKEPVFVSNGVHETYFKTNEEGSEGAAATGFGMMRGVSMAKNVEFVANRPFLEVLVDNMTNACLFLNRVEDPR